jgi:hypothetical protein
MKSLFIMNGAEPEESGVKFVIREGYEVDVDSIGERFRQLRVTILHAAIIFTIFFLELLQAGDHMKPIRHEDPTLSAATQQHAFSFNNIRML